MSLAPFLLVAIIGAVTLASLRTAQWCQRRLSLNSDVTLGLFLLGLFVGWWLAGAFFGAVATGMDDVWVGLSALMYVLTTSALLVWSLGELKKKQLSS